MIPDSKNLPLVVDLDETLVKTDTLLESLVVVLKRRPWQLFSIAWKLRQGKAAAKKAAEQAANLDVALLPYHKELLDLLKQEHAAGRKLVLATGSDESLGKKVMAYFGIFSEIVASDGTINYTGERKAKELVRRYGEKQFIYAGNGEVDVAVWRVAAGAIVISSDAKVLKAAKQVTKVVAHFESAAHPWRALWTEIRSYQWIKNSLLFLPLLMGHQWSNTEAVLAAAVATVSFSLTASALYLVNDLFDLAADRRHPRKRFRPLAAGELPIRWGVLAVPVLLVAGVVCAFFLPISFLLVLGLYALGSLLYSFLMKEVVLIDVLWLSALYIVRIVAGSVATNVPISFWLLAFALFLFFSLALVKRCAELVSLQKSAQHRAAGRSYTARDMPLLVSLGASSGFLAVLVLAFYIDTGEARLLYDHPTWLWLLCPLILYWIIRTWFKTWHGQMHGDPIIYAAKDRGTWLVAVLMVVFLLLAL